MNIYKEETVLRIMVQRISSCGKDALQKTLRKIKIPATHWEKLLAKRHTWLKAHVQDIQRNLTTL